MTRERVFPGDKLIDELAYRGVIPRYFNLDSIRIPRPRGTERGIRAGGNRTEHPVADVNPPADSATLQQQRYANPRRAQHRK